jgi:assimilatory nitrate reductase electron transfer subunit
MTAGPGRRRLVVIGNGMAGCRFVQEVVRRDPGRRLAITVVGDEPGGCYNRAQLTNLLAGATATGNIQLAGAAWYAAHRVALRAGTAVTGIDRAARHVQLDDGTALAYDVLVLATGSMAVLPPVTGLYRGDGQLLPGATAFRTLADCVAISRLAATATSAVVLGAGVLGLETARGLAGRGLPVTLVQRGAQLMGRQLDADASRVLTRTARSLGVRIRPGAHMRAVRGNHRVRGVALEDGTELDADLLVLCCGVRPRVELARQAGLAVATGVLVDDQLRSTDPRILAIGECAEHRGRTYEHVEPAWEQARVAAQVVAGPGEPVSYHGSLNVTRLQAAGIELASLGEAVADPGDGSLDDTAEDDPAEVIRFTDPARGIYQKLVVRDGRLSGAILLGDTRCADSITQLFDRQAALPADRAALLVSWLAAADAPPEDARPADDTLLPAGAPAGKAN